ncbi:MAG: PQQ-binding-like beta-propeller repeat protein [Planctomycetaceae bacterium]
MNMHLRRAFLTAGLLIGTGGAGLTADDWPQWRGPFGDGRCLEQGLPVRWSASEGVLWKLELPEAGNSTPVIHGNRIFVTQPDTPGKRRSLWCIDRETGVKLWERSVEYRQPDPTHSTNPLCSSSAVTDGERVVVWFGSAGVFCFDMDGTEQWSYEPGEQRHIWGYGSSPVLHGDLCYLNFGPGANSRLLALNKRTGKLVWEVAEPLDEDGTAEAKFQSADYTGSWSTPLVAEIAGRQQLVLSVPFRVRSFDPLTGREFWVSEGTNALCYTSPLTDGNLVVAMGGYNGMTIAVRGDGSGDVTASHRVWRHPQTKQRIGSGVIHEGHIYIHNDPGVAECFELSTGKLKWEQRLSGSGKGVNWSSVMVSDGLCYSMNQGGDCFVFRASPEFELVSVNSLGESTNSSVAASGGRLFLRTHRHLWCVGAKSE